ncbi:conserved hypothetical protein [Nocardioides sp. AX2bis]|nr:conserved hypothetical protein [Nocardioides sp. AX2bis]
MRFRRLDLGDDAALAEAYAVECAATARARPGWVPLGEAARVAAWRAEGGWTRRLVGAVEADRLVGLGAGQVAADTPDTCWVAVSVLPEEQHHGVGSALVRAVEAEAPAGVRRFVASAYRPTAEALDRLVQGFATPLGYAQATTETVVELDLHRSVLPTAPAAPGYTVATFVDGVPDRLRAQVGELMGLVDAEAPHGDLGWEPTPVSPEQYAAEVGLWRAQGRTVIESLAQDGRGDVVAWTCLLVAADQARPAQVEGTVVRAEHRGRGLGRAVKVASLRTAQAHGGATRVRTSSDDANVWMRSINDGLGFVPVESEVLLQTSGASPAVVLPA